MTFAAPAYLALLALAPLVVYLHMRRHAPLRVPSASIWRQVLERSEPRPRVRPVRGSLALWLQLAAVALAAVALAEPLFGDQEPRRHALVVDAGLLAGAEREGDTAYEEAWRSWLASLPEREGDVYSVWRVGPRTTAVALELGSKAAVRRALERTSHVDAPADWLAAALALRGVELAGTEVTVVAADVEAARAALGEALPESAEVLQLPTPGLDVGLLRVTVEPVTGTEGRWRVAAEAAARGEDAASLQALTFQLRFTPAGGRASLPYGESEARLSLGRRAVLETTVELPGPGVLEVVVRGGDALAADDAARFVVGPAPARPRALVVSHLGEASPSARLLRASGRFDVAVTLAPSQDVAADLVVIEDVGEPVMATAPAVVRLGRAAAADPSAAPAPYQAVAWDAAHPLSAGTRWGLAGTLTAYTLPEDAGEVVVEGPAGPLVSVRATATGRELLAGFDPTDPAFVDGDSFVSLMVDAASWLAPARARVEACTVGEPCRLPWSVAGAGFTASTANGDTWASFWSERPGVRPPARADEAWTPERAGLWEVVSSRGETLVVAVNPPFARAAAAVESSLGLEGALPAPAPTGSRWRDGTGALVAALLALVLLEGVLAGRQGEAFWQARALRAPGATGGRSRLTAALHVTVSVVAAAALLRLPLPAPQAAGQVVLLGEPDEVTLPAGLTGDELLSVGLRDPDAAVDVERALSTALAHIDPAAGLDVLVPATLTVTRGDALAAASALAGRQVRVHTVPGGTPRTGPDAAATALVTAPERFEGDVATLVGVVHSLRETTGTVRFYLDDQLVAETETDLPAGWSVHSATAELATAGPRVAAFEVAAAGDAFAENDRVSVTIDVRGGPAVRLYANDADSAAAFADALALHGYAVDSRAPHTMPIEAEGFAGLHAVALLDVPAIDLTRAQQDALEAWVRERGGGLLLIGGEHAFGPGGYLETPLDALSPVSSKVSREAPAVAMLFVLDRSGSMQQLVDGVTRLELAKEATLAANELLGRGSEVAVVVFDEQARTLLPFTPSDETDAIRDALRELVPGGGTALLPGLEVAADLLSTAESASKHVVVMTDGLSQPGDVDAAVARIVEQGATVSAIAIGLGSDVERVRGIARLGGGTAHTTTDFRALPSILAQEAMMLSGDPVLRETFVPVRTGADAGLMAGMPASFPPLAAVVETTPKADATVLIDDGADHPVLAAWRYGAGRVVAFTSQAVGPWSAAWSQAEVYADWWSQWLRWTVQTSPAAGLDLRAQRAGDGLRVEVLATSEGGAPLTGLDLVVGASQEGAADVAAPLRETAPGRYVGTLPLGLGGWTVQAYAPGDVSLRSREALVMRDYPAALGAPARRDPTLEGLVATTGGQRFDAGSVWRPTRQRTWTVQPAWRPWLLAAIALWLVFLVLRYAAGWLRLPGRRRVSRAAAVAG